MKNKLISLLLVAVLAFTLIASVNSPKFLTVSAASEQFLSEVALVYEDSVEDARAAIAGTDWKLYEKDLNEKANPVNQDGVYLIYKTSTNVEDAITDLRVMNMAGGFSINDYQKQIEKSKEDYKKIVDSLRVVAKEFKAKYDANDPMTKLAYRQMNYYKDIGETDKLMGDFVLSMAVDNAVSNDKVITVMMQGNAIIFANIVTLMVVGLSGLGTETLTTKIENNYAIKDTLTDPSYYDDAAKLAPQFVDMSSIIRQYELLSADHDVNDDDLSEEELNLLVEYGATTIALDGIEYGKDAEGNNRSLKDFLLGEWQIEDLKPIVASLTAGQKELAFLGQFESILKYGTTTKDIEKLTTLVEDTEAQLEKDENGEIKPISVYLGVDRTIFNGSFAYTTAAERQQALTGTPWTPTIGLNDDQFTVVVSLITTSLLVAATPSVAKFVAAKLLLPLVAKEVGMGFFSRITDFLFTYIMKNHVIFSISAAAIALIVVGAVGIMAWYNYYNPDYTEIPSTIIDVRETDLGDKYIRYDAAKVFGEEEDKNADFNAYEGKQWIALYYSKDANAGNCLTPNFVYRTNSNTVSRRHQGVSMFGESNAYNLNSHVYRGSAPTIFLTVRYSTTKKAAAGIPDVVGSMISQGAYYAISGIAGIGIGVGFMAIWQNRKTKKSKDEEGEINNTTTA